MSSRSAARKMTRTAPKPHKATTKAVRKGAPRKAKPKLARVTRFPTAKVKKQAAPKKVSQRKDEKHETSSQRNLPPLTAPRAVQQPKQSLARSFYWSELRVGDDLPPLTKPAVDRVQIVRYAAAAGDFNRLHLDEPYAHMVGFPGL